MQRNYLILFYIACLSSWEVTSSGEDWTEFRGPTGQGQASAIHTADSWSEDRNIVWKVPVPGTGWSSPVVLGNQVWMTSAVVSEVEDPSQDERLQGPSPIPRTAANNLVMRAICLAKDSGRVIHDLELLTEPKPDPIHTMNSYASPSPVIEPGRVYCHFGANGTACVDTETGTTLWLNRELTIDHVTGAGSSPILWQDLFIVHCDGADEQYIAALHKSDGKLAWKTARSGKMADNPQFKKAYSTPLIHAGSTGDVLLSPAANWLYAYDPATGKELWKFEYGRLGFSNVPRPIASGDMIYVCTGYMKSHLLALRLDSKNPQAEPTLVWSYNKQVPQIPSPVIVDQRVYFVSDQGGILTCLDAATGDDIWRERLGGTHAASLLYAGGLLYVAGRNGETHVIQPGDTFQLVNKNVLDAGILASPISIDGALFLRTEDALYRVGSPTEA